MSAKCLKRGDKYLILFSYMGNKYRGLQKQTSREPSGSFDGTIQSALELALNSIEPKPVTEPVTRLSSRTDHGVHSLLNAVHSHLRHPKEGHTYFPHLVTQSMNRWLKSNDHTICVKSVRHVPQTFNCQRNAKWRQYIYRLAIIRSRAIRGQSVPSLMGCLPATEMNRCHIMRHPERGSVNYEKMGEAVDLFRGTHDFASFMAGPVKLKDKDDTSKTPLETVKCIDEFTFEPIEVATGSHFDALYENVDMFEFRIKSNSFLYQQIRRMVGSVLQVGGNRMGLETIEYMLSNGDPRNWHLCQETASPFGLYLAQVHYDEEDMLFKEDCQDEYLSEGNDECEDEDCSAIDPRTRVGEDIEHQIK